jgi:hypothetical protein
MRHSTLVASATVLLGVGLVSARLVAQTAGTTERTTGWTDPQLAPPQLAAQGILKTRAMGALTAAFQEQKLKDALRQPEILARSQAPIDCGMIVAKGDPAIDPQFVKQPPSDRVKHTLRLLLVPRCPE